MLQRPLESPSVHRFPRNCQCASPCRPAARCAISLHAAGRRAACAGCAAAACNIGATRLDRLRAPDYILEASWPRSSSTRTSPRAPRPAAWPRAIATRRRAARSASCVSCGSPRENAIRRLFSIERGNDEAAAGNRAASLLSGPNDTQSAHSPPNPTRTDMPATPAMLITAQTVHDRAAVAASACACLRAPCCFSSGRPRRRRRRP